MERSLEDLKYTNNFFWHQRGIDLIGNGSFGKVHKGRNRVTGEFVAIKIGARTDDEQHKREIGILRQLDSPHIVKFIACEEVIDGQGERVLVMELADNSLRDELKKLENMFGLAYRMLLQLIDHLQKGLSYLNSKKIAHRDVKPENVLVFNRYDGITFKLCDFGGSKAVTDNFQPLHSICGTPGYLNEYTTANLAHKTKLLSYTKDECDLWSVGCTLFECATGVLPFVPLKGPMDSSAMYNMMINRPSDAIYGRACENGEFLWRSDFPEGRCLYPKSFRRVLREFIRCLFDRREATRLTFARFDEMCVELLNLKRIRVFKLNTMRFEEYFDASNAHHFERSYFDEYAKIDMPAHDLICMLTLPAGSAVVYQSPPVPVSLIDRCSDIIIMGLRDDENYTAQITISEPVVHSTFPRVKRFPTLHEIKLDAANTLNVERQTYELQDAIFNVIQILRAIHTKLLSEARIFSRDLNFAKRLADQLYSCSKAIAIKKETMEERKAVENNACSVVRELNFIEEAVKWINDRLQQIDESITVIESKPIVKAPSLKCELETIVKMRTCCAPHISFSDAFHEDALQMETDRQYLLTSHEKTMKNYHMEMAQLQDTFLKPLEMITRDLFDSSRKLYKTKKQLHDSLELIAITDQTNKLRLESVQTNGNLNRSLPNSTTYDELPTLLMETKQHARQQKIDASKSLESTNEWLRRIET